MEENWNKDLGTNFEVIKILINTAYLIWVPSIAAKIGGNYERTGMTIMQSPIIYSINNGILVHSSPKKEGRINSWFL